MGQKLAFKEGIEVIEIKCSEKQKEVIIESLLNPNGCLWPRRKSDCVHNPSESCKKCFEDRIKWEIR